VCNDLGGNECGYIYEKMIYFNHDEKQNDNSDWARCKLLTKKESFLVQRSI